MVLVGASGFHKPREEKQRWEGDVSGISVFRVRVYGASYGLELRRRGFIRTIKAWFRDLDVWGSSRELRV